MQWLLKRVLPGLWGEPPQRRFDDVPRPSGPVALRLHVSPVGGAQADFGVRRVAALLAEGDSVHEIAAAAGYREVYVRCLLSQVNKKHGLSGQAALVRLVIAAETLPRC